MNSHYRRILLISSSPTALLSLQPFFSFDAAVMHAVSSAFHVDVFALLIALTPMAAVNPIVMGVGFATGAAIVDGGIGLTVTALRALRPNTAYPTTS